MFHWQAIIVTLIVGTAAAYVTLTIWRSVTSEGGGSCGSCGSCDADDETKTPRTLVNLDETRP